MQELIQDILSHPSNSLFIIGNLILIESLLSVDNAAVLATMVLNLPENQRKKALKWGIWGAYVFRGLALLFASFLIQVWWLKPIGGVYLLYLFIDHYRNKNKVEDVEIKEYHWLDRFSFLGPFWRTVILVEIMDLAFSIDNVFAAVAFSDNLLLIWIGVFIGILAMRFVAQYFVKLLEDYPVLEHSAFWVIGILGLKLLLSLYEHSFPTSPLSEFLMSEKTEWGISILSLLIFFLPLVINFLLKKIKES